MDNATWAIARVYAACLVERTMTRTLALLLICLTSSATTRQSQRIDRAMLAFTDVTVIGGTGAAPKPHMTVVIAGEKIATIETYRSDRIPTDARVVDARGKFIIPGLWDVHVHWYDESYLPLFIANGVHGSS